MLKLFNIQKDSNVDIVVGDHSRIENFDMTWQYSCFDGEWTCGKYAMSLSGEDGKIPSKDV